MTSQAQTVFAAVRNTALAAIVVIGCAAITANDVYAQRSVTQGRANTVIDDLYKCPVKVGNHRISAVGTITSTDGKVWTVPAEHAYQKGPIGADLFNECNGVTPAKASACAATHVRG